MKFKENKCKYGYTLKECNNRWETLCQKECELTNRKK